MGKPPSDKTRLRNALSDLRRTEKELSALSDDRNQLYRKSINLEREIVEWKYRFDVLLRQSTVAKKGSLPDGL